MKSKNKRQTKADTKTTRRSTRLAQKFEIKTDNQVEQDDDSGK